MFAKHQMQGLGLDPIVKLRGSTVQVHVVHVGGPDPSLGKREADCARGLLATLLQSHAMKRLAGGTVAGNLSEYVRSARLRVFEFFEHKHPCALGENEAVAI